MDNFRRVPGARGEQVIWRSVINIPDDVIDPELLAESNPNDAADQTSLHQQPPQLLAESSQSNNVEQTSVYQHPQLDVHQSNPQRNPCSNPQLNPQFNPQPLHVSSAPRDGSVYQRQPLDVRQSNPFSNPHANHRIIPHFHSQPDPQPSPQAHSPPRDGSVYQHQPFNPFALAYSPPQDGRVFFQRPAVSHLVTFHPGPVSQGDAPASSSPGTPHLQQDSFVRANVQSPARSRSQSFSLGFGQGPMMEVDEGPFQFQAEADSSPLSSLTATPAIASATVVEDMAMDLDHWEPGREAQVGIPSSSPPRNENSNNNMDATPKRPRAGQREDLQGREGQYQRPRRYNIDLLLERVTIAPVADMESTSHDPSLQRSRSRSQENARPRAISLGIGSARREDIMGRIPTLRAGISFPSGVPYSTRYSEYTQPPKNFSRPLGSAQSMPPPESLAAEHGQPLSAVGVARIGNVSGPQTGESSRHGQHLETQAPGPSASSSAAPQVQEGYYPSVPSHESYTEGVMQHKRAATPGPSGSASNTPSNPQPATSGHGLAGLVQRALQEASVSGVVAAADAILNHRRGLAHHQHLRKLAPKPPREIEEISQQVQDPPEQNTQSNGQAQQQDPTEHQSHQVPFTNMELFQPILAPAPTIQSPLLISPFPLRIPGTFTPAILSLAIDPPRSLQIGTTDSLRSYLKACGIVPYNDIYPRTIPVPREPFNRTVIVEARYLSVIGLLYPRAEFIVSRIAEGAEQHMEGNKNYNKKLEPNSAMMMEKWHVYKAIRMTGEEMQKLGVCVWSEKGCGEWEPVVEPREVKRMKRTEMVVVDDDGDEEDEEESDDTVVASSKAMEGARKENTRATVEEDEEADEDVEMVDAEEEEQTSRKRKGKAKDTQGADKKGKGKEVLQEKDGSSNAAGPFASKASASASAPLRRSTRVQSRQASAAAEEAASDRVEDKATAPPSPKVIITRKLRAIQLDETGESSSATAAANPSRPIKTPKPRLTTTKAIHPVTEPADPRAPYLREASIHYFITLRQRDWPSGGVARIQCTPKARQTIEYIQDSFGIQSPYELWRQKDYRVWNGDTGEVKRRYIKVMRVYAGDENTEDGVMRLFLDEMERKMKEKEKRRKEKGKGKEGEEETGDGKDMSSLEERKAWKESYKALKRRGKKAVARAKGKRKEGEDMDMDFDEWLAERREEENELLERWFEEREGVVEEEEHARKTVEFAMFEYGGGDGLGLGKA